MEPETKARLTSLFDRFDLNRDGLLDREEYAAVLTALESAKFPRGAFLFHRVVEADEDGLTRATFAERLGHAAANADVCAEDLLFRLEPRTPPLAEATALVDPEPEPLPAPAEDRVETGSLVEAKDGLSLGAVHEKYEVDAKPIGAGGFAKVYFGKSVETGENVAIKVVDLSVGPSSLREMVVAEVMIMVRAKHAHIVNVKEFGEEPDSIWMSMDFMSGGDLQQHIARVAPEGHEIPERVARDIFFQLLDAMDYLHNELEIVHRDLKPENVLLKNHCSSAQELPHVSIGDFGLSTNYDSKRVMKLHCGTPAFFAPELILGQGYSRAVDCWSLGLILFCMLCAKPAFRGSTHEKLTARICAGTFEFEPAKIWEKRASSARDLIQRLLTVDPLVRYTAKEALEHPWSQGKDDVEGMVLTVFEMLNIGN